MRNVFSFLLFAALLLSANIVHSVTNVEGVNNREYPKLLPEIKVQPENHIAEIEAIKGFEGFRSKTYECTNGHKTIGYGFTKYFWVDFNQNCSKTYGSKLVVKIYNKFLTRAKKVYPCSNRTAVIAHLFYWVGESRAVQCLNQDGTALNKVFMERYGKYKKRSKYITQRMQY